MLRVTCPAESSRFMLIAIIRNILAILGIIWLVGAVNSVVWPLIQGSGVVNEGSFREIDIGRSKYQIAAIVNGSPTRRHTKLKLYGYLDGSGDYVSVWLFDIDGERIAASDTWYLSYPGFLNEIVELSFEDDYLKSIRYTRAPFDP